MEKMMDRSTKTAAALLALAGGLFASAAIAEMGPGDMGGMQGHGDRGAIFMQQFDLIDAEIGPMRARYEALMAHPERIEQTLQEGAR